MSEQQQESPPVTQSPRRLFVIALIAAVLGLIVTLSFGYADHHPTPHGVRLAVFIPARVHQAMAAEFAQKDPGAFTLVDVPSPRAAERFVVGQKVLGAFIVPPSGSNEIITAGAQGTTAQTVITEVLTEVSAAMHRGVRTVDAVPLKPGDESGLGAFVFTLGLLVPSVLGSVGLLLFGNRLRLWWRVLAALVFALLAACGGTLAMDTIFGALTGAGGELIGIGFLGAAAFVLFVAAIQALVGLPGTGLVAIAFIFVGNAISGGSVPVGFLPNVFRQIAPWLPNNAIIRGVRDVVYYHGHDLGHSLLVFGLWIGVALLLLAGVDLLQQRARSRSPHLLAQIYATPGVGHLRGQIKGAPTHDSADLGAGAEPEAVVEAEPGGVAGVEPAAEPVAEPVAVAAAEPDAEPEPVAVAAVEPDPDPERVAVAAVEPDAEEERVAIAAATAVAPEHHLPELPANSGIPRVPADLHRAVAVEIDHAEVTAQTVTVHAHTVIITAGEVTLAEGPDIERDQ